MSDSRKHKLDQAMKIVDELESLGIEDYDKVKEPEALPGDLMIKIFDISAGPYDYEEVERAAKLIGKRKLTCKQAKVICKNFSFPITHPKPFLTKIMFNISDKENISTLAKAVLTKAEAANFIEKFEVVTGSPVVEESEPIVVRKNIFQRFISWIKNLFGA